MRLWRTTKNTGRRAKDRHSKRSPKATLLRLEPLESRTLLTTVGIANWASVPTAQLRQPSVATDVQINPSLTATQQTQLQPQVQQFPADTVYANGSLQYTNTWVGESYGGYPATAPDGGTQTWNEVQRSNLDIAAGPLPAGQSVPLMAINNSYQEAGTEATIYENGAPLSTNNGNDFGGRGIAFSTDASVPYFFQSCFEGVNGVQYMSVARYTLAGELANFTSGPCAGANDFGVNVLGGNPNFCYIYSTATPNLHTSAIAYYK